MKEIDFDRSTTQFFCDPPGQNRTGFLGVLGGFFFFNFSFFPPSVL